MNNQLSKRIDKVRRILADQSLDALLLSNFFNIAYITGFTTLSPEEREAYVLVTKKSVYLFTDARYHVTIPHIILKTITPTTNVYAHLEAIIKKDKLKVIGFEKEDLKYLEFNALNTLKSLVSYIPVEKVAAILREIKTTEELKLIKKACQLTDQCLFDITDDIKPGVTEKELAWRIEVWVRVHGCELSFAPIVAADKNSAIPHYDTKTGNGRFTKNSLVLIDFGINYHGYLSDITRMFSIGRPKDQVRKTYEKLLVAQIKTVHKIPHLKQLISVDRYCRRLLQEAGLPHYQHGTGHGIGLEVHEAPKVTQVSKDTLKAHQVLTIEPGVYLKGNYGMRVEDTIYINAQLQPEILTKFPKELRIV